MGNVPGASDASASVDAREGVRSPVSIESWFVLRVSYGRAAPVVEHLRGLGVETYYPMQYRISLQRGHRVRRLVAMLPGLLFVRTTRAEADRLVHATPGLPQVSYYYNHFQVDAHGLNPPLVVDARQMDAFICATRTRSEHLRMVSFDRVRLRLGQMVEVVEGEFTGVSGRVVRYAGQQRVAVSLGSAFTVLTAYVPTAFLRPVGDV